MVFGIASLEPPYTIIAQLRVLTIVSTLCNSKAVYILGGSVFVQGSTFNINIHESGA